MANNRVYIRFTRTGNEVFFMKYYPGTGWYVPNPGKLLSEIERACEAEPSGGSMFGLGEIELAYEISDPGFAQANATIESLVYRTPDSPSGQS